MTQPVAPGGRVARFDEPPAKIECTSPPPPLPPPPALCAEGLQSIAIVAAARSPPPFEPRISAQPAGLRFCREADTVVEGFLCNERVVVSNACRKPNNAVDAYICDEPRMRALQSRVWQATLWVIKTLASQILARGKGS